LVVRFDHYHVALIIGEIDDLSGLVVLVVRDENQIVREATRIKEWDCGSHRYGKWWWYSTAIGGGRARQMVVVQHSKWWSRASSIYMLEEALEKFSAANWIGGKDRSRLAPNRENLNRLDQILH
jgi:hypothetical protein